MHCNRSQLWEASKHPIELLANSSSACRLIPCGRASNHCMKPDRLTSCDYSVSEMHELVGRQRNSLERSESTWWNLWSTCHETQLRMMHAVAHTCKSHNGSIFPHTLHRRLASTYQCAAGRLIHPAHYAPESSDYARRVWVVALNNHVFFPVIYVYLPAQPTTQTQNHADRLNFLRARSELQLYNRHLRLESTVIPCHRLDSPQARDLRAATEHCLELSRRQPCVSHHREWQYLFETAPN